MKNNNLKSSKITKATKPVDIEIIQDTLKSGEVLSTSRLD